MEDEERQIRLCSLSNVDVRALSAVGSIRPSNDVFQLYVDDVFVWLALMQHREIQVPSTCLQQELVPQSSLCLLVVRHKRIGFIKKKTNNKSNDTLTQTTISYQCL